MVGWRVYLRADYRDSHATNRTTGLYATYGDTAMSALAFSWGIAEKLHGAPIERVKAYIKSQEVP